MQFTSRALNISQSVIEKPANPAVPNKLILETPAGPTLLYLSCLRARTLVLERNAYPIVACSISSAGLGTPSACILSLSLPLSLSLQLIESVGPEALLVDSIPHCVSA